jgi:DNA transformation protein
MASSPDFVAHCVELFESLGAARAKGMFGGHGLYVDDVFIAVLADDVLYLKVDDTTKPQFEAAGRQAFIYEAGGGKKVSLGFWTAPEDAIESPALFRPWARLAMEAALRARNKKKPAAQKAAKKTPPVKTRAGAATKKATPTRPKPSGPRQR